MILYVYLLFVLLILSHISGHFLGHRPRIFTHRMGAQVDGIKGAGRRTGDCRRAPANLASSLVDAPGIRALVH